MNRRWKRADKAGLRSVWGLVLFGLQVEDFTSEVKGLWWSSKASCCCCKLDLSAPVSSRENISSSFLLAVVVVKESEWKFLCPDPQPLPPVACDEVVLPESTRLS